jgi:hypothetical protein
MGSVAALWAPVAALALIGCGGSDATTEPVGNVDARAIKQATYVAELLPLPPGASLGQARDVNSKGQIVGYAGWRAVRWDPGATAPVELEMLPGHERSYALGISDGGDIVGGSVPPRIEPYTPIHVVRWPASGGVQDLGEVCCINFAVAAINKRGDVAWVENPLGSEPHLLLHLLRHEGLTTVEIPNDAAGGWEIRYGRVVAALFAEQVAINNHDDVAFGASIWSPHGGWSRLSSAYAGPGQLEIWAINDRNAAVAAGWSELQGWRGTLYPRKGAPLAFGVNLVPQSINNLGVMVGLKGGVWFALPGGFMINRSAVVRYADGTTVELPNPSDFPRGSDPVVSPAQINDDGIIVGFSAEQAEAAPHFPTVWRPVTGR